MSEAYPFSYGLTIGVLLILFIVFLARRIAGPKGKLTLRDFMSSVLQAVFASSAIITGINLICMWVAGELRPPRTLIEPVNPILSAGFILIALSLWVIYENLRGLSKKR